jgi:hypothetical protein
MFGFARICWDDAGIGVQETETRTKREISMIFRKSALMGEKDMGIAIFDGFVCDGLAARGSHRLMKYAELLYDHR